MKIGYKMFFALTLISLLSGGILSVWDGVTAPKIQAYRLAETKSAIREVLPQFDAYKEVTQGQYTIYIGMDESNSNPVGVAFRLVGNGFQGPISLMVGIKPDFKELTGLKVLEQSETPGLGSKITEDPSNKKNPHWFTGQFAELLVESGIKVIKNLAPENPNEIQAISGATISSKAIAVIIESQLEAVREVYLAAK